jgi:thiol:disulfide interchange protein
LRGIYLLFMIRNFFAPLFFLGIFVQFTSIHSALAAPSVRGIAVELTQSVVKLPLKFTYSVKRLGKGEFDLQFTAALETGWHIYSQNPTSDGPIPTSFDFIKDPGYQLMGKTTEPKAIKLFEPAFGAVISYFENRVQFHQKIKVLDPKIRSIKGSISGMVCKESCMPFIPPIDFDFQIPESDKASDLNPGPDSQKKVRVDSPPAPEKVKPLPSKELVAVPDIPVQDKVSPGKILPVKSSESSPKTESRPWYLIFIFGFLGGFAALMTPCVFPMIPMTVSFFTKRSKTKASGIRNALIYSASIIILYVLLGLLFTAIYGPDAPNRIASNVWVNLFIFVMLVVFAISFLGAFEIVLPSAFVNKIDSLSDRGGLVGIFFMALTLAVVSFSCTSGIIGALLSEAAKVSGFGPFWGMLGFSIALALPFGLFAAFPGWLNSLPKSGGWLNTVKVFLGFLELALAFKFASIADYGMNWGILSREVFLVIWIVVFGLLGIYLLGGFKLAHDTAVTHLSVPRLLMAMLTFAFTIYLIPGLWGAPLKLISGLPPPLSYSEAPHGLFALASGSVVSADSGAGFPVHAYSGPNGITAFDDLEIAQAFARKVHKPLMLDFTGRSCVNCRRMEEKVWSDPEVIKRLNNDLVLVSLYVDDPTLLPLAEQKEVEWNGKRILKTVGNKWSFLQSTRYGALSQPQYRIIAPDGTRLSDSTGYDPDVKKYVDWLDAGVIRYKRMTGSN